MIEGRSNLVGLWALLSADDFVLWWIVGVLFTLTLAGGAYYTRSVDQSLEKLEKDIDRLSDLHTYQALDLAVMKERLGAIETKQDLLLARDEDVDALKQRLASIEHQIAEMRLKRKKP